LARDVLELTELQGSLLKVETKEAGRIAWRTLIWATLGITFLVAALPVALFAVAQALTDYAEWPRTAALGAAAVGSLIVSAIATTVGWRTFQHLLTAWRRSSNELSENVAWLKATLDSDDPSPSAPRRQANPYFNPK
jgi:hypothetical protein